MTIREVMRALPENGKERHALRSFNLRPAILGKARSVKELAEEIGFDVRLSGLPSGMNGRLVADAFAENGYCIEINSLLSNGAKRFALLHEMGHYFLHRDESDPLEADFHFDLSSTAFYPDDLQEREANEFAQAVLFGPDSL